MGSIMLILTQETFFVHMMGNWHILVFRLNMDKFLVNYSQFKASVFSFYYLCLTFRLTFFLLSFKIFLILQLG